MSISYKLNNDKNGVEIRFTDKPSDKVRGEMKALGFRWSNYNGVWYAKQSEETIAYAKKLASEEGEQITLDLPTVEEKKSEKAEAKKDKKPVEESPSKKAYKEIKEMLKSDKEKAAKPKTEVKKTDPTTNKAKKDDIVVFPKARPEVKVAITDGNATYEDCKAKLEAERKIFCDSDSQFVIDGLLKMCEVNPNFRNNVIRKEKTYSGAFKHFMEMARNGYALQYNGVTYLDNNIALGFAIDYFNEADVPTNVINGQIKKEG